MLAVLTVNTPLDERDFSITDGDVSIRDAIDFAIPGDTINFNTSVMNGSTIELNQALGQINIEETLTIDASMLSAGITIDASAADPTPTVNNGDGIRIFDITDPISGPQEPFVALIGLRLTGGDVSGNGGAIRSSGAELLVRGCVVEQNAASDNGGGIYAVGHFEAGIRVEKSTISGNTSVVSGGGIAVFLYTSSSLVIEQSTLSGNRTDGEGGGLFVWANTDIDNPVPTPRVITVSRSLVSGNTALDRGGGVYIRNFGGTETLIQESRITGNYVPAIATGPFRNGGGLYAYLDGGPKFTITGVTVDNNEADHEGGGIFVCSKFTGEFIATNTTISGNRTLDQSTGAGGGMFIARFGSPYAGNESIDAYLRNVTITQNISKSGGGVEMENLNNVRVRIANSIISENFSDPNKTIRNNLVGRVIVDDFKHNLIGTGSSILDHTNGNPAVVPLANMNLLNNDAPFLGPLQDNGGPTLTHSLLAGSPAIDKGSNDLAKVPLSGMNPVDPNDDDPLGTDQRGTSFPRIHNIASVPDGAAGQVDIGAYEIGLPKVIEVIVSGTGSEHAPYNFANAVGSGEQLRTVPVGGANRIQIRFSEVVTLLPADVTVQSALNSAFFDGSVTHSGNVTTWTLINMNYGVFHRDQLILKVSEAVSGLGGLLDGDWINQPTSLSSTGTSVFPSGNGMGGGDFLFRFTILSGDFNHDNVVDSADYVLWRKFYFTADGAQHWQGDADGDGDVESTDYYHWQWGFGLNFTQWPT